ncbi:MAG: hypothetical protein RL347_927, partial [Actinomycetota bacterium]
MRPARVVTAAIAATLAVGLVQA